MSTRHMGTIIYFYLQNIILNTYYFCVVIQKIFERERMLKRLLGLRPKKSAYHDRLVVINAIFADAKKNHSEIREIYIRLSVLCLDARDVLQLNGDLGGRTQFAPAMAISKVCSANLRNMEQVVEELKVNALRNSQLMSMLSMLLTDISTLDAVKAKFVHKAPTLTVESIPAVGQNRNQLTDSAEENVSVKIALRNINEILNKE